MLRATLALLLLALSVTALSCGQVRTTGPKTSLDYCVDDCDNAYPNCSFSTDTVCRVEYDGCVERCGLRNEAKLQ